jgi:hypothetical protein
VNDIIERFQQLDGDTLRSFDAVRPFLDGDQIVFREDPREQKAREVGISTLAFGFLTFCICGFTSGLPAPIRYVIDLLLLPLWLWGLWRCRRYTPSPHTEFVIDPEANQILIHPQWPRRREVQRLALTDVDFFLAVSDCTPGNDNYVESIYAVRNDHLMQLVTSNLGGREPTRAAAKILGYLCHRPSLHLKSRYGWTSIDSFVTSIPSSWRESAIIHRALTDKVGLFEVAELLYPPEPGDAAPADATLGACP